MSPSEIIREDGVPIRGTIIDDAGYRAYQLRQSGADWESIARQTGYATGKSAQVAVRAYITRAATTMDMEKREEVLTLEMDRLDALQSALWPAAMEGDTKSVDSVLRVMGHRAKLLGLDLLSQGSGTTTIDTVVVTGDTQEFIRSLRLVRGIEDGDPEDE